MNICYLIGLHVINSFIFSSLLYACSITHEIQSDLYLPKMGGTRDHQWRDKELFSHSEQHYITRVY